MWAICEGCLRIFEIQEHRKQKLTAGIERVYYKCKYCGREITAYYISKEIKDKQLQLRNEQDKEKKEQLHAELKEEIRKMNEVINKQIWQRK
jgi:hypothetical protein